MRKIIMMAVAGYIWRKVQARRAKPAGASPVVPRY